MKKVFYSISIVVFLFTFYSFSGPTAGIYGKITDKDTGDPILFANVALYQRGKVIAGMQSDYDGNYRFDSIPAGTYDLEVSFLGYTTEKITNISLTAGSTTKVDVQMRTEELALSEIVVCATGISKQKRTLGCAIRTKRESRRARRRRRRGKSAPLASNLAIAYNVSSAPEAPRKNTHHYQTLRDSIDQPSNESYEAIIENPFLQPQIDSLSTFSIDVDAASYSNIRRFINNGSLPEKDAVRIEEMINYFEYDYPEPTGEHPFEIITEMGDCPWQEGNKLLHIGLQGKHIDTEKLPASNLVFLIDVSGSMDSPNKLPLLVESFKLLADNLRDKDKVTIVVYAGAAGMVLPPTSGSEKEKIKAALDQLSAGGSTAGGAGIQLAYNMARKSFIQGGNNRVILATDGDFNVGISNDDDLIKLIEKERNSGVFLTVLGFGTGNYQDAKMQKLADKGNGNHAYIDNIMEAKKVLISEFGGLFTIAKDVKLQLKFNPQKVAGYRLIGYENRMLANEDFDDDKKDAGELGAGHTVTALYEIIPAGVESPYLAETKSAVAIDNTIGGDDWVSIRFRYKKPEGRQSILLEETVIDDGSESTTSDNFRWSAAAAEFGLILRDSKYKGHATWSDLLQLAKSAKGKDQKRYRQEMIELIKKARKLSKLAITAKAGK